MGIRPLHDRVLVEPLTAEEKTAGGIIIPDTAQEKPQEGKIIAVGNGAKGEDGKAQALDVKKGDKVLYGKWSGTEVKVDGKDLLIMKESDIMGIISSVDVAKAAHLLTDSLLWRHALGDVACCAVSNTSS